MTVISREIEEFQLLMDALKYLIQETFDTENARHRGPIQNLQRAINLHVIKIFNQYEHFASPFEEEFVQQGIEFARRLRRSRQLL